MSLSPAKASPLSGYLVRQGGGASLVITRHRPLEKLAIEEQLIATLIKRDAKGARRCLEMPGARWVKGFTDLVQRDLIAGYLLDSVLELGLNAHVEAQSVGQENLLQWLHNSARHEAAGFVKQNGKFAQILSGLGPLALRAVLIKGPVLARQLYKEPHFRLSSDLDFIVPADVLSEFIQRLRELGFQPEQNCPAFCNQLGVGPVESVADLLLTPSPKLSPGALLTLAQDQYPSIDVKVDPLERGVGFVEVERFWNSTQRLDWEGYHFLAPDFVDHILISCDHLTKHRFSSWKWLIDVSLLTSKLSAEDWRELCRRTEVEQCHLEVWAGLCLSRELTNAEVPDFVLDEIRPKPQPLMRLFAFTANPLFLWNGSTLPMLYINAIFLGAADRKLQALRDCIFPSKEFLSRYYAGGRELSLISSTFFLLIHWLVLVLPAGTVRRTFGKLIWKQEVLPQS